MGDVGIMGMHVPGMSWREMRDSAVLAEDLGYSCLSMGESWGEDALTSLAQLAAVTSRIRIGTSIVPVFARSPANLAMAALNLDRMSEGRFFLGLGTSGRLVIQDLHGERFDKPLTRMREYIDIIRKASRGEMLDHDGEFFHTKRFRLRIPPYRPGLPIYIASLSPASLRLTGEVADGWLPIFLAPSRMTAAVAELEAGAKAAGRSWRDVVISPQVSIYVTATSRRPGTASAPTSRSTSAAWACSITSTCTASASAPMPTGSARRSRRVTATARRGSSPTRWWTR